MLHTKSSRRSLLKLLALVPIVGLTLALNAKTVTTYVYDEPQKQQPVKKGAKAGTIKMGKQEIKVVEQNQAEGTFTPEKQNQAEGSFTPASKGEEAFDVVEEMPQFPGGSTALLDYLRANVKYPKEAEDASIQGRVIVTFVVGKDGSVSDARIVRSVDPLLDNEALRVISGMPNWTPGRQSGKAVNVKYTVPISFNLNRADTKKDVDLGKTISNIKPKAIYISGAPDNLLILVDGKEVPAEKMKDIAPNTIDRMEVLKDKDAIEKYGEKAKNGVIIITTKQ